MFQSRRGPVAALLYGFLVVCSLGMGFALAPGENVVAWAKDKTGLEHGDRIDAVAGHDSLQLARRAQRRGLLGAHLRRLGLGRRIVASARPPIHKTLALARP